MHDDERYQAATRGTQLEVPLFFFQGMQDLLAPPELVTEFMSQMTAPHKELVPFPEGGHNAFYTDGGRFPEQLLAKVRLLAVEGAPPPSAQ